MLCWAARWYACWCRPGLGLVGLYSRCRTRRIVHRVYQHRDGTSQRRRGCILLLMLVRPSGRARTRLAYKTCLRTPQREDAAPKSPETRRQFTRTEPSPEGVWGLCNVAPVSEEQTPSGCAAQTRRRGSRGDTESSSPGSSPRRDRHRARDRRSAAAGRAGLPLPLCVCLPARDRSTTRSTVVVQ